MGIRIDSYKDKTVAVMGLGRSGLSTVRALIAGGATVRAWDDNEASRAKAAELGAEIAPLDSQDALAGSTALVLSPGIPHTHPTPHPVAVAAKANGLPIIGDIELLGLSAANANYVGITGTNGKSTTTTLIGHILENAGRSCQVGGNLGIPALDLEPLAGDGSYVMEMSSYQLELTHTLTFHIGLLLNISNDHLDRHGGMDGYVAAKMRLFDHQGAEDVAIVAVDDDRCAGIADALTHGARRVIPVSARHVVPGGVYLQDGHIVDDLDGEAKQVLKLAIATTLPGVHNAQNAVAAYAACRVMNLDADVIVDGICSYPGLPHRQQAGWRPSTFPIPVPAPVRLLSALPVAPPGPDGWGSARRAPDEAGTAAAAAMALRWARGPERKLSERQARRRRFGADRLPQQTRTRPPPRRGPPA